MLSSCAMSTGRRRSYPYPASRDCAYGCHTASAADSVPGREREIAASLRALHEVVDDRADPGDAGEPQPHAGEALGVLADLANDRLIRLDDFSWLSRNVWMSSALALSSARRKIAPTGMAARGLLTTDWLLLLAAERRGPAASLATDGY
jgi:hypothetical protein